MLITFNWLKEFLDTKCDVYKITDTLNMIGLESEIVQNRKESLKGFKVAKVAHVYTHPQIPKLKVCKVQTQTNQELQIICGAPNVAPNLKVILAPVGTVIPANGMQIAPKMMKNVLSQGMLCSAKELLISDESHCILECESNLQIGQDITECLVIGDVIINVDITPNRGDCMGIYGIARDLAAKGIGTLKSVQHFDIKPIQTSLNIKVLNPELIPRLNLCKISGIEHFKSPTWLKQRLQDVGIKVHNNVVDVASFVSHSFAQPLHLFDADKISNQITVGLAKKHNIATNKMQAINLNQYDIAQNDIVHVDQGNIVTLSGIIGDVNTSITHNTKSIVVESAIFDKTHITQTGQRLNLTTDARKKFERHVDSVMCLEAIGHFVSMLQSIIPQCHCQEYIKIDNKAHIVSNNEIIFSDQQFKKFIGIDLPGNTTSILNSLGFKCSVQNMLYKVVPPSWRSDIINSQDVYHEILRIHGYDSIEATWYQSDVNFNSKNIAENRKTKIKVLLASLGYSEMYTWSFANDQDLVFTQKQQEVIKIANPISKTTPYMRNSLIPNLIKVAHNNQSRSEESIAIFELGSIFNNNDVNSPNINSTCLGILKNGLENPLSLYTTDKVQTNFFNIKGSIEQLFDSLGIKKQHIKYSNDNIEFLHPKKSVYVKFNDENIGYLGHLHPLIQQQYELKHNTVVAQINIDKMLQIKDSINKKQDQKYFCPSEFQITKRDLSFLVDKKQNLGDIISKIYTINTQIIKEVILFDVFSSNQIPTDKKSFAIQITMQSRQATLTETQINSIQSGIIQLVENQLNAQLRKE